MSNALTLPAPELIQILEPAYRCPEFDNRCNGVARWNPEEGHVPRGYLGATASTEQIEVIILLAEPGDPFRGDTFPANAHAGELIASVSRNTMRNYTNPSASSFHANMRRILDFLFPTASLDEQLRKTWITETVLCSAHHEGASVPAESERACAETYLARQLQLLPNRPIVALGGKAQKRVRRLARSTPGLRDRLFDAWAASPPGANNPKARRSWKQAAEHIHDWRTKRNTA